MSNAVAALEALASTAQEKGAQRVQAICLLAIARIAELEAALLAAAAKGGKARAAKLSPESRKAIAQRAAHSRWHACGKHECTKNFTEQRT